MIKTFIDKLLGKPRSRSPLGKRVEVGKDGHGIDPTLVDERAVKVVQTLVDGGHEAYIVGGAVRDLLLGLRPKDFDVATNATPEQVKALFRRAFIIGRRFRIVHVVFGRGRQDRGLSEVIEVSTFRAMMDSAAAEQVAGNEKTSKHELAGKTHVVDAEGRVLRDNVWGPQIEDAARRDFTVNAMYYDPVREVVVDYHGGIKDSGKKLLRMIGDPEARYREDPVRIVRAVRFAAKLGFEIEPKTRAPIKAMAALLENVPQSRMFDEMIKLLQTGHSLASLAELRKQGLDKGVFPLLDAAIGDKLAVIAAGGAERPSLIELALRDTDRRVAEGRSVAPSFMLACLLWHEVLAAWERTEARGEPAFQALQLAIDEVFDARIGDISGRGKLGTDMRDTWLMQPRFERRSGNAPFALADQPRFRAGYDFLQLRAEAGEVDDVLAAWWKDFTVANDDERRSLVDALRQQGSGVRRAPPPARPARAKAIGREAAVEAGTAAGRPADSVAMPGARVDDHGDGDSTAVDAHDGPDGDEGADGLATAVKKRRRRRRRPSDTAAGDTVATPDGSAGG